MRKVYFLVWLGVFVFGFSKAQTVNYVMQTGNFNSQWTTNTNVDYHAGAANQSGTEIKLFAYGSGTFIGNPGVSLFQLFSDNGNGITGAARPLTVGDQFQITCYVANSGNFFDNSNAGITFNENVSFSDFADFNIKQRARFQINKNDNWFVASPAGDGYSTPGQDVTFTLTMTSSKTGIVTISSPNGATTYDLDLANSPSSLTPITSFALWNQTSGNSNDMFWKNGSLTNLGVVEFGGSNANKTVTGIISDGLLANSTSISQEISLVKNGSAILTLNATNTYTGPTTINTGRIKLLNPNGLGDVTNGTTVANGAVLELASTTAYPAENLILNGTGVSNGGALIKSSTGTQIYNGNISLGSDARITVSNGSILSFKAVFDFAGHTAYFGGTKHFEFAFGSSVLNASKTTGNGAIFKDGSGILYLRPEAEISGDIVLMQGEIRQMVQNGFPSAGSLRIKNGATYRSDGGTLREIAKSLSVEGNIILGYSGGGDLDFQNTIDLNGTNPTLTCLNDVIFSGQLTNGGLMKSGSATLSLSNNNSFSGDTRILAGSLKLANLNALKNSTLDMNGGDAGTLSFGTPTVYRLGGLTGSRTIDMSTKTLEIGSNNTNTTYSGMLSNGALTKLGTGALTLSGNNTYTGNTTLQDGVLTISAADRIADGSNFSFNGGAFSTAGHNETVGTIDVNSNSDIQLSYTSHELHFQASDLVSWTAGTLLTITGWVGSSGNPGILGKIFVGTDNTGLTALQLSQIKFDGYTLGAQILGTGEVVPRYFTLVLFDDFNRVPTIPNTVGQPSNGGPPNWNEMESGASGAQVNGAAMWLQYSISAGREAISYDMTDYYPVAFDESTEDMIWAFNMYNDRNNPSGFDATNYGAAFILGCNKSNYTDADAFGYAVVLGGSVSPSPLRLVHFENGLKLNSNITDIASFSLTSTTNYMSINVTYNSCSHTWSLIAREEASFTNPSIGSFPHTASGTDPTHTSKDLPYLGALWNHNTGSEYMRIDNIYIPKPTIATDNVYTWKVGTGSYTNPSKWTPDRTCARARDVLIFDGGTDEVTGIPDETIGQLIVRNNATVTLKNVTTGATSTLTLTGGPGQDLLVESGCVLNLDSKNTDGGNGIVVDMNTATTGEIAGTLRFDNTSSQPGGRPHQLLVTDPDAVHIKNGGRVEAIDLLLGNNPFGDQDGYDAVVFESGSTYLQASGSNPFGYAQPKSKVVFEPGSWFHFTSSGEPSISGRTYANFRYEAGTTNVTLGNTNYSIDTLIVDQGVFNLNLLANAAIAGDIEVSSGSQLRFNPPSPSYSVTIDAPVVQNISGTGTMTIGANTTFNLKNQNRINIQKNITVTGVAKIPALAKVDFQGENKFNGSGTTNILDDSKVYLGSSGGITTLGATGNIQTTTRTYSGKTAYVYDGTTNQITGTGLPATLSGNGSLEIDNPGNTVTLTYAGTTETPLLTLSNGLFSVGAANTVAITAGGAINSSATSNFAAGNLAGTVSFIGAGAVYALGNLDFYKVDLPTGSGGVNFGLTGTPNIQNEFVISNGRSVQTNGPFYANGSTLIYNTDGPFTAATEWYAFFTSGRGVPYNVQVGRTGVNDTKLYFGTSTAWRYCRGTVNIGDGIGTGYKFYLSTEDLGDLKLEGDFIVNTNGTFDANKGAVYFTGSTDQTITSFATGNTVDFSHLILDKPSGDLKLNSSPGTTVNAMGNSGDAVLVMSGGDLDLQGQEFNLGGAALDLKIEGTVSETRIVKSSTPAAFNVIGTKQVVSQNGTALVFNNQVIVNISAGMDFGPGITTINATLQINSGGYANLNAPIYGPLGVLKYNTGSPDTDPYKRRVEWNGTEGNPGYPNDVIVAGNTALSPGGDGGENTGTDFGARRDVTIESGSAIYMDAGGVSMTVPFVVGRNLTIDGSLSGSQIGGGDIYIAGNWVRSSTGHFYPNDRQVLFNGSTAQTITADGGEIFDYLAFENAGTKTLNDDITVNKNLDIFSGSGALTPANHTISLAGKWNNTVGTVAFDEGTSTVIFKGTASQELSSAGGETFYNLEMNNAAEGLTLNDPISIKGNLNFIDGLIDATVNQVDFEETATNSGSGDASYINGFAQKTGFVAGTEFMFPVGQFIDDPMDPIDVYQPAGVIASNTSTNASFKVDYHHQSYFPGYTDPNNLPPMQLPLVKVSTCNYWNINRTNPGTDAKVKLYWTDACLDINDPTTLVVAKVNGVQWESHGQSAVNSTAPYASGYVVSDVVSGFSPFAIGSTDAINVLPIELLYFTASAKNDLVETQWVTSTEINNDYFTVERSVDAEHFEEVGRLDGAGNSTSELNYGFIDDAPYSGISYYRLKQTDFDGRFTYSAIRSVEIDSDHHFELLQVYRSESGLNLTYRSEAPRLTVKVFDLLGKQLFQTGIENVNGRAVIYPSLARGVYLLRLSNGVDEKVVRFFW